MPYEKYIEDFNRLIFSADMDLVKNPTSRTLWFHFENQNYSIAAGESFRISESSYMAYQHIPGAHIRRASPLAYGYLIRIEGSSS